MKKILEKMYEEHPVMKVQMVEDDEWRSRIRQELINEGMSENDATQQAWNEYWKMAKERDGVEFSINKLL